MIEIRNEWISIHWYYLEFAYHACNESVRAASSTRGGLNKPVLDAIRYSIDCLEASAEFLLNQASLGQLPGGFGGTPPSQTKWKSCKLPERFDLLATMFRGTNFYLKDKEQQLLVDLKTVRNALTHPIPFGTTVQQEIIERQELEGEITYTRYGTRSELGQLGEKMAFGLKTPTAGFSYDPFQLDAADAERAVEIMLRHLHRINLVFWGRPTTEFALSDESTQRILNPTDLLLTITTRFDHIWPV